MPDDPNQKSAGEIFVKFILGLIVAVAVLFGVVVLTCGGMLMLS